MAPGGTDYTQWLGMENRGTSWAGTECQHGPATPVPRCPQRTHQTCHRLPQQPPWHDTTFNRNGLTLWSMQLAVCMWRAGRHVILPRDHPGFSIHFK